MSEPDVIPIIAVTEADYKKTQEQAALWKTVLAEKQAKKLLQMEAGQDTTATVAMIAEIEADIAEIEAEGREYDLILRPRSRPEKCRTCTGATRVDVDDKLCANCGMLLVKGAPPAGYVNWVIPDEPKNVAAKMGVTPNV